MSRMKQRKPSARRPALLAGVRHIELFASLPTHTSCCGALRPSTLRAGTGPPTTKFAPTLYALDTATPPLVMSFGCVRTHDNAGKRSKLLDKHWSYFRHIAGGGVQPQIAEHISHHCSDDTPSHWFPSRLRDLRPPTLHCKYDLGVRMCGYNDQHLESPHLGHRGTCAVHPCSSSPATTHPYQQHQTSSAGDYRTRFKGAQTRRRRLHRCHGKSAQYRSLDTDCASSAHGTGYLLIFGGGSRGNSGPGGSRSVVVRLSPGGIVTSSGWPTCPKPGQPPRTTTRSPKDSSTG